MEKNHKTKASTNKPKDKELLTQSKRVFEAFSTAYKTVLMVSIETNIPRANVYQYVSLLKKTGRIELIKKDICPISNCHAGFYATGFARLGIFSNDEND